MQVHIHLQASFAWLALSVFKMNSVLSPRVSMFQSSFRLGSRLSSRYQSRGFTYSVRTMANNASEMVSETMKAEGGAAKGSSAVRSRHLRAMCSLYSCIVRPKCSRQWTRNATSSRLLKKS